MRQMLSPEDLFVRLERAFRRRARVCRGCVFTLPFRIRHANGNGADWSVIPSSECSETCRFILEDLVTEHQQAYQLAHGVSRPGGRRRLRPRPH